MELNEAIMAFSQSEKIKGGLIWISQTVDLVQGLPEVERKGGERVIQAVMSMIGGEVKLANNMVPLPGWADIEPHLEKAKVMALSGVFHEVTHHLAKALSMTTTIGQQSLTVIKERGAM